MWNAFKFVLSAALVGLGALLLVASVVVDDVFLDPGLIAFAAVLLLLAAMPWIVSPQAPRALGLVCIALAIGCFVIAFRTFAGLVSFPMSCSGRRASACRFENYLHELGGNSWAGTLPLLMALFFLAMGAFLVFRRSSQRR